MPSRHPLPFARHGAEKTIYDARMQPQAVYHEGIVTVAYQANPEGLAGHPHVVSFDTATGRWSQPRRIGFVEKADHHLAPILWIDAEGLRHVLYGCHRSPGKHLVSARPDSLDNWREAEPLGRDVSFPAVRHLDAQRRLLTFRDGGHLGRWAYRVSDDGRRWSDERPLIDFSRQGVTEADRFAGAYVTTCAGRDPDTVYLGLCRWDERDGVHPRYAIASQSQSRYDLYCMKLNVSSGVLTTAGGEALPTPVNRAGAEAARAIGTGWELSNFPALSVGPCGNPYVAAPVTDGDVSRCQFRVAHFDGQRWIYGAFGQTGSIWSALMLRAVGWHEIHAYAITGGREVAALWGGGELRRWISFDNGATWHDKGSMVPDPELLYNNPQPVARSDGGILPHSLVCYGWKGPGGIWDIHDRSRSLNRGRGYLWLFGQWV